MKREKACLFLNNKIKEFAENSVKMQEYIQMVYRRHDIPIYKTAAILHSETPLTEVEDVIIYCLIEAISNRRLELYFSELELELLKNFKYVEEKFKFPLELNVNPTVQNTWRGEIDIDKLMEMRDSRFILLENSDYDIEKHRYVTLVMQLENNEFRPQTLCFKLLPDTRFEYNKGNGKLSIYGDENFHIYLSDGYETYLALSNLYNGQKTIDFNIPVKITV